MGATGFSTANRKTRVGNMAYQDTDEPTGFENIMPAGKSSESQSSSNIAPSAADRQAATSRSTGGEAVKTEAEAAPASARKGRRTRTLASLESSVNKPSILGG